MYARRNSYRSPRQWSPYQVPTWPVEIDTDSELAGAGLVAYWLNNRGIPADVTRNYAAPVAASTGTPTPINSSVGPGLFWNETNGNYGWQLNSTRILSGKPNWTVAATIQASTNPTYSGGAAIYNERGPTGGNILKVYLGSNGGMGVALRDDASNLIFQDDVTAATDGALSSFVATYDSSNVRYYNRGALTSTQAWAGTNTFTEAGVVTAMGYDPNDGAGTFLGTVIQVALFSTTLTAAQVGTFNRAPFGLLRPTARRMPTLAVTTSTADAVRSLSYLLGTDFRDGLPDGTITPAYIRELIVSAGVPADTTLTDGAAIATDCSLGNAFNVTLGGTRVLSSPTNLQAGRTYYWRIIQDGTGSRTLTYGSAFKWAGGTAPTLTTTAGATDLITALSDGTNLYATFTANLH